MTFEEWSREIDSGRHIPARNMHNDWKAEREKLIGALEELSEWDQVAFYPGPNEDPSFQSGYMTAVHDAERQINRKLAEVMGEKKELPKFKDIIGLFVDKPEEEKG